MKINLLNPVWKKLILGQISPTLNYLAAKIALGQLRLKVKSGRDGYTINDAVKEIYGVYLKGENLPNAKKDIETLLNY